ncbi:hypothetical protein [Bradyrhizobium cajani]|uniref:Uncharacterized protein n=1 Tax=Bradyrhizobium cajani TaxID=1928661 RepID=A0A844T8B9_9BRAD|nr:hypothetical protein [Bradyrhizobium cajani]MCP3369626.1 hypothetical protein [Bradyrhizobium cajani]MVT75217.1 hypothetical protein [Bradyrhizobium cajani]
MRRARRIVNEMEFRMWREAKSFSPAARAGTMKGFSPMHLSAERAAPAAPASFLRNFACAHRSFSKAALC